SVPRSKTMQSRTRQRRTIGLAFHQGEPKTSGVDQRLSWSLGGNDGPRITWDILEPSTGEIKSALSISNRLYPYVWIQTRPALRLARVQRPCSSQAARIASRGHGSARHQATSLARVLLTISESVPDGPTTRHMPG